MYGYSASIDSYVVTINIEVLNHIQRRMCLTGLQMPSI